MDNSPLLRSSTSLDSEVPNKFIKRGSNVGSQQLELFPVLGATKFNWLLVKRLFKIFRVLFPRLLSVTLAFFLFLVFVSAVAQYNYYYAGLIPSRFYGALTARKEGDFRTSLYQSAIVLVSACLCKSAVTLVSGLIYVRWRALLTQYIHKLYFKGLNFYKTIVVHSVVDNPDQRITQDVERFCNQLANHLLPKLILWPFIVAYYTYKTFSTMGYIGVLALYGYFIMATIINKFLMGPVISLVVEQESREGDFRFHHVHVRSNPESIAFYGGELLERDNAMGYLGRLLKTQLNLNLWMFPLNLSVNLFDYFGSIITYIILGVIIFYGSAYDTQTASELSVTISQNAFFSLYLLNNFSTLIDQSSNLADMAGYAHRVGHLIEVLLLLEKHSSESSSNGSKPSQDQIDLGTINSDISQKDSNDSDNTNSAQRYSITETGVVVAAMFDQLTITSLNSESILLEDFTFRLERHNNVLITGQSGAGKTSLLRVLKQLWPAFKGKASISLVEADTEVMFVPQKPFLTFGSLSDQITYPKRPKEENQSGLGFCLFENRIDEALRLAGLTYLRDRFGGLDMPYDGDWSNSVSPGEMQKITFARLFYYKPSFAFLDEATSAMTEEDEDYFYSLLKQMGITFMSIGHRSTIKKFHDVEVHFAGDGSWTVRSLLNNDN